MPRQSIPLIDRLWKSVDKNGPLPERCPELGRCWLWTQEIDCNGFGIIYDYDPRRRIAVHHLVYEIHNGVTLPPKTRVWQLCDVGHCCNPEHLKSYSWQERFWLLVNKNGPVPEHCPDLGPCWPWLGALDAGGYPQFRRSHSSGMERAHRVSYEIVHGEIPDGKEIDHICHDPRTCNLGNLCPHRSCANPDHLKPATSKENCSPERSNIGVAVKDRAKLITHCPRGHEYTEGNTYLFRNHRQCNICRRDRNNGLL